jgi:hypothetical protein
LRVGPPVRVAPRGENGKTAPPQPLAANSFAYTVERRERSIYFPALLNGEETENYFGPPVTAAPAAQTVQLHALDAASPAPATLEIALQGVTANAHAVRVALNGEEIGVAEFNGQTRHAASFSVPQAALREGANEITLAALNGGADVSLTDYLRVTYARRYEAVGNRLRFTAKARQSVTVTGFTAPDTRIYDVTDPARALAVAATVQSVAGGYAATLPAASKRRELLAVGGDQAVTPVFVQANQPSDWRGADNGADFAIISRREFRAAVEPLAALRRSHGLETVIVDVEDIYDEWSNGAKNVQAVSAFLRWTQTNWRRAPRYVLLVGDASHNPRNYLGYGETDVIPTRYVATAQLETASDEVLTDFDGDGVGEIGVGRLPARDAEQAAAMIEKIVAFQPNGNGALFVADNAQGYDFAALNRDLRAALPNGAAATEIIRNGNDTITRAAILNAFNAGPSVVSFAGHGSVEVWTGAGLLQSADAARMTNGAALPFVANFTCLNGYFHDLATESLAEALLRAPRGGAVGVWASTALTNAPGQNAMARELFRALYAAGPAPRLGDALRQAKRAANDAEVRQTWILFGDPTLQLR